MTEPNGGSVLDVGWVRRGCMCRNPPYSLINVAE